MRWIPLLICLAAAALWGCDAGKEPYNQAVAAETQKDYDAALAKYKEVLGHPNSKYFDLSKSKADELDGKIARVKAVLAAIPSLESNGAYDEALANLQGAENLLPGYRPTADAVSRVKQSFASVLNRIGDAQVNDRKFDEAEATYRTLGKLDPADSSVEAKLRHVAEERANIPYQLRSPRTAHISDVKVAGSAIAFTLFNATPTNDHGPSACFRAHPEWETQNGRQGRLEERRYEIPNGQSQPIEFAFPDGRSLPADVAKVIIVVESIGC